MWQLFLFLPDNYVTGMAVWLLVMCLIPVALVRLRRRWSGVRSRLRLVYAGLSLWLCLTLLTVIEVSFALLYDTTDSFDMTNVSHRWFQVHVEPDVRVLEFADGSGIRYRDVRDFNPCRREDIRHICFLGDSFTFGHGVPEVESRFSNQVEQLHAGRFSRWMVSNLAWPGTDLVWGQSVVEHLFNDDAQIDDVVYVLCLNDIETFHDPTMSRSSTLGQFEPPTVLFRDTYFFNWLCFRTQLLTRSDTRNYYSFVKEYYQGPSWDRFRDVLEKTAAMCRTRGVTFRVAIFPFLHNLTGDYPFREIHRQIFETCRQLEIPCLDLDEPLAARASEGLTVNPFDAHPNELAHGIAAEALHRWLESTETVPQIGQGPGASESLERGSGD